MKNMIITLLLASSILTANAQSRESRESTNTNTTATPIKIEAKSTKLRKATGWKKDILGTWISNTNAISDMQLDDKSRYSVPQNFKWIQFTEVFAMNAAHYAILYESEVYISGMQKEKRVYYYLLSTASYHNLVNTVKNKSSETLTIQSNSYGYMSNSDGVFTQQKLLSSIYNSLSKRNNSLSYLRINAQHVDQSDVVRFVLPEQSSPLNAGLDNYYFEVSWDSFNSILLPTKGNITSDEFELEDSATTYYSTTVTASDLTNTEFDLSDRDTPTQSTDTTATITEGNTYTDNSTADSPLELISDRVSEEGAIVSTTIAILKDITGWYKNTQGKWVSDKENDYSYNFESVGQYELRHLTYREIEYIILIRHEKYAGSSYYLIKKDDYDKELEKIYTSSMLNFPLVVACGIGNTLDDLVKEGVKAINTPEKEKIIIRYDYLTLQHRLSTSKNVARFFIFERDCTQYGEDGAISCDINVSNKIKYDEVHYIGTESLFGKMYYETNYTNFINFLKIGSKKMKDKQTYKDTILRTE